ncbi:hypothetical protein ACNR9V_20690 (plasmid) [Parageobacillus thermoglucosidasius]|uniref:hypothetical protein n=1 Tax=Parageobacillus thermoglucosidasius TaxID=1426 RepID=UPI003B6813E7
MVGNQDVEVILLGVQPYSFKDKDSGRQVEGVNVYFIERKSENSDYGVGFVPRKASLPMDVLPALKGLEFPYSAKVIVEQRFTNRGVMAKIVDFKPSRRVSLGLS